MQWYSLLFEGTGLISVLVYFINEKQPFTLGQNQGLNEYANNCAALIHSRTSARIFIEVFRSQLTNCPSDTDSHLEQEQDLLGYSYTSVETLVNIVDIPKQTHPVM